MKVKDIIDEEKLNDILNKTKKTTEAGLGRVLVKALKKQGLALEEVSLLLNVEEP